MILAIMYVERPSWSWRMNFDLSLSLESPGSIGAVALGYAFSIGKEPR